ncbi:unnamed protein product [Heterobilharzia americana]|nr:unnamed protein product [Heterobilharzia americana]
MKKSLVAALLPTSSNTISTEFVAENNSFLLRSGNSDWLLTVLSTVCILCAGILYYILLLSVTVRSRYPTNYILMGIVAILTTVGVIIAYPKYDIVFALKCFSLTAVISLSVIALGFRMGMLTRSGLILFISLEVVFSLFGVILISIGIAGVTQTLRPTSYMLHSEFTGQLGYVMEGLYTGENVFSTMLHDKNIDWNSSEEMSSAKKYLLIAGDFCLIVATLIILFVTSIELKFHLNHAFKKYYLIFDALTIWMEILLLYLQISEAYCLTQ